MIKLNKLSKLLELVNEWLIVNSALKIEIYAAFNYLIRWLN